jgi:signal transduction histidine kinase
VIRNLLGNALKFSPVGGTVEIRVGTAGGRVCLCVFDEGPGIPANELDEIFAKFVQSSRSRDGAGGTGLGLAICRTIVDRHHGRIWADNRTPRGAVLSLELPVESLTRYPQESDHLNAATELVAT